MEKTHPDGGKNVWLSKLLWSAILLDEKVAEPGPILIVETMVH
jgi:hypothetical protein